MKVYFNLEKRAITDVDNENQVIFTGDVLTSELQVISDTPTTDYYVTVSAKLSNGRTIGPFLADVGGIITDEHSTTWKYTLSSDNGFTLSKGITNFYIWLMPVDCTNKSQKCLGAVVVNVGEAFEFGDDYFIAVDEEDEEQCFINMKAQVKQLQQLINSVTTIVANPEETASTDLNKVKIGSVTYSLADLGARSSINAINGKIPSEASSLNKLADKKYVDDGDEALQNDIDDAKDEIVNINKKIPSAASQNNQLADKQYVDDALEQLSGELQEQIGDVEESVGELEDSKQDNINDLAAIRSGASAGATAYQKPSGGIPKTDLAQAVQTSLGKADVSASKAYVDNAIGNLPEPMIFKGTLGNGGTITSLPTASPSNEGFTYKVITAGTYASQTAKVGDVFVSTGSMWSLIPAGDDAEDTWRAIQVNGNNFLGNGVSSGVVNFTSGDEIELTPSGHTIRVSRKDFYQFDSSQKTMNEFFTLMLGVDTTTRLYDTYDKKELIAYRFTGGATGFYVSFVDDTLGPATLLWTADAVSGVANRSVHETLYIGLNATSGDYLLNKVNKVSGMGLSTNDFTNTDKANISKSLYHLGAFDIYPYNGDNTKVRRRTGYKIINVKELTVWWTPTSNTKGSPFTLSYQASSGGGVATVPIKSGDAAWSSSVTCVQLGYNNCRIYWTNDWNELILIQYPLDDEHCYTENVIEGESILPLDSNMAQMIRQDVVDGLNLFDTFQQSNFTDVNGTTTTAKNTSTQQGTIVTSYNPNNENRAGYIFNVNVGQVYNFSCSSDGSAISIEDGNGSLYNQQAQNHNVAFTPTTNKIVIRIGTNYTSTPATISNIMLCKNHPYPYEPYNQKEHITNDEATLLKQEEEKCRNLLPNSANITAQNQTLIFNVNIIAGKTYTFSIQGGTNTNNYSFATRTGTTDTQIVTQGTPVNNTITFTASGNADNVAIYPNNVNNANFMLNEGNHAYPYQAYNGAIVHEKDLEPTLLWENGSPNSAFAYSRITLPSGFGSFKYLIVEYRQDLNDAVIQQKKIKIFNKTGNNILTLSYCSSISTLYYREIRVSFTDNDLELDDAYNEDSGTTYNSVLVPTAIYGSNV